MNLKWIDFIYFILEIQHYLLLLIHKNYSKWRLKLLLREHKHLWNWTQKHTVLLTTSPSVCHLFNTDQVYIWSVLFDLFCRERNTEYIKSSDIKYHRWSLSLYLPRVAGPGTAVSAGSIQTLSDRSKTPLPSVDLWSSGRPRADRQPAGPRSRAGKETEEVCLINI